MTQHTNVLLPKLHYTRTDYTALRAYCQRIPVSRIESLYYSEDSPQVLSGLEKFLSEMRNNLVDRAIEHNPNFAEILKHARSGGQITVKALDILVKAADTPTAIPQLNDPIAKWLKPKTVQALKSESLHYLNQLIDVIRKRGPGWYRSIPRIGKLRAEVIAKWINSNATTLGEVALVEPDPIPANMLLIIDPARPTRFAPLERISVVHHLNGEHGVNRASQFCFIQARNDKEAIHAYLSRFLDQAHTYRAYSKELERFLLWSVIIQKKPLSSLLVDDCEAYKSFLRAPAPHFQGVKAPRTSTRWKPFSEESMSAKSQKQAILIIRSCFHYLVQVRYLAGNPWVAVKDPSVLETIHPIKIERALPEDLWERLINYLQKKTSQPENKQERIALAAMLLMGDSGLRRHEVANSKRSMLSQHPHEKMSLLRVHGKGNKERLVPVSERTIHALEAHWNDLFCDFYDLNKADNYLLSPVHIPQTETSLMKHQQMHHQGYAADALYPIIMKTWKQISETGHDAFNAEEIALLKKTSPHAFRHTFGTLATEAEMPIDVVQSILGHASATTTGIYNRTREKRMVSEAAKFFNK